VTALTGQKPSCSSSPASLLVTLMLGFPSISSAELSITNQRQLMPAGRGRGSSPADALDSSALRVLRRPISSVMAGPGWVYCCLRAASCAACAALACRGLALCLPLLPQPDAAARQRVPATTCCRPAYSRRATPCFLRLPAPRLCTAYLYACIFAAPAAPHTTLQWPALFTGDYCWRRRVVSQEDGC